MMNEAIAGAILPGCQGILTLYSCEICFICVAIIIIIIFTYDAHLYIYVYYTAEQWTKLIREWGCVQEWDEGDTSR